MCNHVWVCVFSSHSFWTSSSLDVPAWVTQEEGHTGFLIHLLSAVRALIFLAGRIQPFLSLVDREVELCVLAIQSFSTRWAFLFLFFAFLMRKTPFAGIKLTSQRVRGLRGTSELPGRPAFFSTIIVISTVDVPVYRPPVYRFALFTGVFFSCHPVIPVYRWYAGIPGWFIFSCSRSPSCCCTLPHTLLHTTQHNTLGVAGSSQHLPTHHAMCGRRIMPT